MIVRYLPAVMEACEPQGVFSTAIAGPKFGHQYVELARNILRDGQVPIEDADFLTNIGARKPTPSEEATIVQAIASLRGGPYPSFMGFSQVRVIADVISFVFTFGQYLIIPKKLINMPFLDMILAHELGHLNNGDSFVMASLWALGKGQMEYFTPFGFAELTSYDIGIKNQAVGRAVHTGIDTAVRKASGGGLLGLAVGLAGTAYSANQAANLTAGQGILHAKPSIRAFMNKWDLLADVVAEKIVPDYSDYLERLATTEDERTRAVFASPAIVRSEKADYRLLAPVAIPMPYVPPERKPMDPRTKLILTCVLVVLLLAVVTPGLVDWVFNDPPGVNSISTPGNLLNDALGIGSDMVIKPLEEHPKWFRTWGPSVDGGGYEIIAEDGSRYLTDTGVYGSGGRDDGSYFKFTGPENKLYVLIAKSKGNGTLLSFGEIVPAE